MIPQRKLLLCIRTAWIAKPTADVDCGFGRQRRGPPTYRVPASCFFTG